MADSIADVCIVGVGGMGGIMAKELASAGLKVVGFERGPAPKKADYAPRDSIRFLIRPEQLELSLDESGIGEVVGREFRGHDVFYRVLLSDGATVISQRPSTEVVPLGSRVSVHPHERRVTVFERVPA